MLKACPPCVSELGGDETIQGRSEIGSLQVPGVSALRPITRPSVLFFPTWHEVRDFCHPVDSFLEVCGLTTPQIQGNGTNQSWTRASKSVSQNTPLQMEHLRYDVLQHKKSVEILWSLFWKGSVRVLICYEVFSWRFGEIKCPVRRLPLHLSFLSRYPSLVYTKICFCSLVTKTVC